MPLEERERFLPENPEPTMREARAASEPYRQKYAESKQAVVEAGAPGTLPTIVTSIREELVMAGSKPGRFTFAIRKQGGSSEDARFVSVNAGSESHARALLARKGLIDPHTEEIVGVQDEDGDDTVTVRA